MARYRFGAHELDLDRQKLRHQGDPVEIDVKALGTLRVLLEHNERVVPKEELLARVWEGIHVSDTVVHSAVARLRKALGQSRGDNSPVATVHRRGYRVVLPVDRRTMPNASADALPASTGPQDPPLLGREGLLENLERATAGVRAGNGQLILLEGPSGIGKTRLCQELSMRTGTGSTRTLWGRCLETHGAADLWPWTRILRDCLAEIEWTEPEHVPPLREALTPLLSLGGCSDEPAVGEAARYRMFDAVRETIARVAEKRARLLVLDDLQYADPTSLELLAFLATQNEHQFLNGI